MAGDESRIVKGLNPNTGLLESIQVIAGQLQTNAVGGGGGLDVDNYADFDFAAVTPHSYNVTLTVANTEYNQALPANCRFFEFQARTAADVRFAFATGHVAAPVAPYHTLKSNDYYFSPELNQGTTPSTLYLASATAGTVVEIIAWT